MKINRLLLLITCLGLLALASCGPNPPAQISPSQARSSFTTTNQELSSEVSSLSSTSGYTALKALSNLTNTSSPFGRVKSSGWLGPKNELLAGIASIRKIISTASASERVQSKQPFDFAARKGIYAWDPSKSSWTKTGTSDSIQIQYPGPGSLTNNTEFWLAGYVEVPTPNSSEPYSPQFLQGSIYVNKIRQAEVLFSCYYGSDGQMKNASLDLLLNPYRYMLSFDDSKSTSTLLSFDFSKGSKSLIKVNLTASYSTNLSKSSGSIPAGLSGYVQLSTIQFNVALDGNKAATSTDLNDLVHIGVAINGGNAGHVVFVTDQQTGDQKPFVQYIDKTQQSLGDVLADLIMQIGSISF